MRFFYGGGANKHAFLWGGARTTPLVFQLSIRAKIASPKKGGLPSLAAQLISITSRLVPTPIRRIVTYLYIYRAKMSQ
jgi:hypothetical protein